MKTIKIAKIILVLFVILNLTFPMMVQATGSTHVVDGGTGGASTSKGSKDFDIDQFKGKGDASGASTSVTNMIGAMIDIIQIVGTGVAIIMLIVLAIKYISAAPGDKADIKKHAVVYVVGAIVLFAASAILGIIQEFATKNIEAKTE